MLKVKIADMDAACVLLLQLSVVTYLQELVSYDKYAAIMAEGAFDCIRSEAENYLLAWQSETVLKLKEVMDIMLSNGIE